MKEPIILTALLEQTKQGNFMVSIPDLPAIAAFLCPSVEEARNRLPRHVHSALGLHYRTQRLEIKLNIRHYFPAND